MITYSSIQGDLSYLISLRLQKEQKIDNKQKFN